MLYAMEQQIKELPQGSLTCVKTGKYEKWYHYENKKNHNIPKSNIELAGQLAHKKYLLAVQKDAIHEMTAMKAYLKKHESYEKEADKLLKDTVCFTKLLNTQIQLNSNLNSKSNTEWIKLPYEKNKNYPEQLQIRTISGNIVRSKSESIIDAALYYNHISFRYECVLQLGNNNFFPDFTILNAKTGELMYWEHFGIIDDTFYANSMNAKIQTYIKYGIIPNVNLITTYESKKYPLSPETVEKMIQIFLL